jgi:hypothetical protein
VRRAWLVCVITWLACTLGWFDRVRVVPLVGHNAARWLVLLIDHNRDPSALPPDDDQTSNRQG